MTLFSPKAAMTIWRGGLPKMAMQVAFASMRGTIPVINTEMVESANYLLAPVKRLSLERERVMLFLFGVSLSTDQGKKASTVRFSEMKAHGSHPSLSDRLTASLISSGLVNGTTPTSVRKLCGAVIPDFAISRPDGIGTDTQKEGF